MLVLTRKVGEKLLIGDDIIVQVIEVNRGNIRLGIEAPGHVSIMRFEVYERIREENVKAASPKAAMDIQRVADLWKKNKGENH
ncbi:MAG: carbon storage regulator CsrA [Desulfobacterales bacterium]|jgi:carbon storage regulator|nr:carbon storage regulator CsrA [Desulfobacterales bacterium]